MLSHFLRLLKTTTPHNSKHTNMHANMLHVFLDRSHDPLQTWSEAPHSSSACLVTSKSAASATKPSKHPPMATLSHPHNMIVLNHFYVVKSRLELIVYITNVTITRTSIRYNR